MPTCSSPGYAVYPPIQGPVAESTGPERIEEQLSSEQADKQFAIPSGPMNISFPPVGHGFFIPSHAHAAHMNYGEGFKNEQEKLIQCQIEVQLYCVLFSNCNLLIGAPSSLRSLITGI